MAGQVKKRIEEQNIVAFKQIKKLRELLAQHSDSSADKASLANPCRKLFSHDYFSLFFFAYMNPAIESLRDLAQLSNLGKVQDVLDVEGPLGLSTLSEMQHVADPALLERVFKSLSKQLQGNRVKLYRGSQKEYAQMLTVLDGSVFRAVSKMLWASSCNQAKNSKSIKLHLKYKALTEVPVDAAITNSKHCERKVLRKMLNENEFYAVDAYYSEDYTLLEHMSEHTQGFITRLRSSASYQVQQTYPLSEAEQALGILSDQEIILGSRRRLKRTFRLLRVRTETGKELLLLSSKLHSQLSAAELSALYRKRWQIELFFRWLKCLLKCRHLMAHSPEGVSIQIYSALIAALFIALYTQRKPSKRTLKMYQFHFMGLASDKELEDYLEKNAQSNTL